MEGQTIAEEQAFLPVDVDGERVTISGIIDLLHITPDRIEIVDHKTDLDQHAESEYRKQLSVYYHIVSELYPDRTVTAEIFYTFDGKRVKIEPLDKGEIQDLVRQYR
ncbi:PD-(D/E)XK nuclease family protein [Halorubrum lacusprofundi]|jgi:hypothetical protein|uniref:PD-(D/E)XK nuclease family protein n=1 Tax=Halorubrum lacusprofundi TaxID=2247 RepID=UPI000677996C|nr:PD-(D/E)XK nuclease family protein [Halorubrum lacusprofundi]